jgi:hypothetical protein
MSKRPGIVFGCIPILAWIVSLPWNCLVGGSPFSSVEYSYLPLLFATRPLLWLAEWLQEGPLHLIGYYNIHIHMLLYTLLTSLVYFAIGLFIGSFVQALRKLCKKGNST